MIYQTRLNFGSFIFREVIVWHVGLFGAIEIISSLIMDLLPLQPGDIILIRR
ncbi:hypothetical protein HU200_019358 [Digitaria exilis]|uniref:Uncharacterized protein n=1 Tax=Digitaria exilis TaxID=1010633 RepID=A0A835F2Y3_9POAL|nr:hypothetical protein HU200_019358 [Digitaria exilis]